MHRDLEVNVMMLKSEGEFLRNAPAVASNRPVHVFLPKNVKCTNLLRVNEGSAFSNECARMKRTREASDTRTLAASARK